MAAATTDTPDARAVYDLAMRLSPADREQVARDLLDSVGYPPADADQVKAAWRAEIARRIDAVRNGTTKTYSIEETMDYLQTVVDEGRSS